MELIESDIKWAVVNNAQLRKPTEMHKNRETFFKLLPEHGFQKAVEKAVKVPMWRRCARKVKSVVKKLLKRN